MWVNRFNLEEWLHPYRDVKFNLAESGAPDLNIGEFSELCNYDLINLRKLKLGNQDKWGTIELREEISNAYKYADVKGILVTTSTSEALFCIFNTLLSDKDSIITFNPTFPALYEVPQSLGCKVIFNNFIDHGKYEVKIEELSRNISHNTKMIVINNPNNPTGFIIKKEDLNQIIELAIKKNIYIVLDEHYRFLNHSSKDKPVISGFDLSFDYNKIISTGSITKCFGMNGLRIGWIVCKDRELLDRFLSLKECLTYAPPIISDHIALIAMKNRRKIITHHMNNIYSNLNELDRFIKANKDLINYIKPTGGAVCFPRLLKNLDVEQFCLDLINEREVFLLPGTVFDVPRHFRMNISYNKDYFREALKRMGEMFKNNF